MIPRLDPFHPGLREIMTLLVPLTFSLGITQVQILAERYVASDLPRGVITSLNLVQKLVNLPLGLVGLALAAPLVPALTRFHGTGDGSGFARTLEQSVAIAIALIAPLSAVCLVEHEAIVRVLFLRGAYGPRDVSDAASMLRCYALGLPAVSASFLVTTGFLAARDALTPALVRAALLTMNVAGNFACLKWLGSVTIPLCFSLMYMVNLTVLLVLMGRRTPELSPLKLASGGLVLFLVAVVTVLVLEPLATSWLPVGRGKLVDLARIASLMVASQAAGLGLGFLLRPILWSGRRAS